MQDAIGKLVDPVTGLTVETTQTSSGTLDFFWWTSGNYFLYGASADHEMFTGLANISISSDTTTINAFLKMAAVSYTFSITPTGSNPVVLDGHGINIYNTERTHQGKRCCGRTPFQTMIEGKEIWKDKFVN